jgi:hypothetical protein
MGSIARPVEKVNDVDLLYIYEVENVHFPRRPIDVDLRAYSREQVPGLIAEGHELLGWAIQFGCVICQKDLYWNRLRAEWLTKLPFPDPEVARKRARKAYEHYREFSEMGDIDAAAEQRLTALTHEARSRLLEHGVYPKSRPELPEQLRDIGEHEMAGRLDGALRKRSIEECFIR